MIDELIRQLQNPDPDVRKRAIMALGKAKDPTALKALAQVVRGDPDPTLRELALKAGQYIRQQTKKSTRGPEDKDLPTTGMLIRSKPTPKNAPPTPPTPPTPPLRRSERKALAAQQPPPPPAKKVVRPLDDDVPETGALLGKRPPVPRTPSAPSAPTPTPTPPPAPSAPPAPSLLTPREKPAFPTHQSTPKEDGNFTVSPFTPETDDDEDFLAEIRASYPSNLSDDDAPEPLRAPPLFADDDEPNFPPGLDQNEDDLNFPPGLSDTAAQASPIKPLYDEDDLNFPPGLGDDAPLEPLRAPPLYYEKEAPQKAPEEAPLVKGSSIVKGRKYNVSKQDEERARGYVNAALSFNLEGDNAKAMKNLTEAIALNPNLINDAFYGNVATAVTGLEGDAAAQMIIDRKERKRFSDDATRKQKDRREEKHLDEAKKSSWADVGFEVLFFAVVVIVGTIIATVVANEALKALLANFAQISKDAPAQVQAAQASLKAVTLATILPSSILSGVVAVATTMLQTVLIHFLSKMMGGKGTWRHLVQVLLSFYNRWTWLLFVVLCISIYLGIATFSPVAVCPTIVLIILALYVTGQTSSKVGEAYDFGGAKGCMTVILSSIVILLINAAFGYAAFQIVNSAINRTAAG